MNTEVRFTSEKFKILPAAQSLEITLWGVSPELTDDGPWMVREALPAITVSVMSGQGANRVVASSITAEDSFFLVARLFDKGTSADITATSLRGPLRQQVLGGQAVFQGLSSWNIAGSGYALSFYLDGTAKVCPPGTLIVICEEQSMHRSTVGGLGGYYVEMMSQPLTFFPDRLQFSFTFPQPNPPVFGRVGDLLSPVQVSFYDAATGAERFFQASEGLAIEARLYSGSGADITGTCLTGTRVRPIIGAYAAFDDLAVQHTAGVSFTLALIPVGTWRATCVNKGIDTVDCGPPNVCCVLSPPFTVYPYSILLSPPLIVSAIEGTPLVPGSGAFQVALVDSGGIPLLFLDPVAGYQVSPVANLTCLHRAASPEHSRLEYSQL